RLCGRNCCKGSRSANCGDRRNFEARQFGCQLGESFVASLRPPKNDVEILALDVPGLPQSLVKAGYRRFRCARARAGEEAEHRHHRLLRARRKRPRRPTAEQSDELPPPHSITSSARARSVGGTVSPSALAVLALISRLNLVGCCTGNSAGFSPLRIRS